MSRLPIQLGDYVWSPRYGYCYVWEHSGINRYATWALGYGLDPARRVVRLLDHHQCEWKNPNKVPGTVVAEVMKAKLMGWI